LLSTHFKTLDVHASTQVTTHNKGQLLFLSKLGVSRSNLSRELDIDEIKFLTSISHKYNLLTEVFVHGSNCIGFSGLCYISSAHGGNSGNRGRCSQPCRDQYQTTRAGKNFPLNLKDNSAFFDLEALCDAGVDSLKIEGRVKKPHYVYTVVDSWRKQLDRFSDKDELINDNTELYKVFNRDFSNAFLKSDINKDMFIDNPRDNSVKHFVKEKGYSSEIEIQSIKQQLYDEKTNIINIVKDKTKHLNTEKSPLTIYISGTQNNVLKVSIKTPGNSLIVSSESILKKVDKPNLSQSELIKRFRSLSNSFYEISGLNLEGLEVDLFIPFKELTIIKNKVAYFLNDSNVTISPVTLPKLKRHTSPQATLSILISSIKDLPVKISDTTNVYYQLPDCIHNSYNKLIEIFHANNNLLPWFPSIIMGNDYLAATEFLKTVRPRHIVTNNMGIAYAAFENSIDWIAGPYLNVTNSYSLLCMKEKLNCVGSFISNEISKQQIQHIVSPENFKLYYSIYHPILLLSSRQCLFHQTTGCKKQTMDSECLAKCKKSTTIVNLQETSFVINKRKQELNCMYSSLNFLNTEIVTELPELFSGFFIDLREIKTETQIYKDKPDIIELFENLLAGRSDTKAKINKLIQPTTTKQYKKGL